MPCWARDSSREPESIQTPMETERTWGMDSVRTSRPLGRRVRRMLRVGDAGRGVRVADMLLLETYCVTGIGCWKGWGRVEATTDSWGGAWIEPLTEHHAPLVPIENRTCRRGFSCPSRCPDLRCSGIGRAHV